MPPTNNKGRKDYILITGGLIALILAFCFYGCLSLFDLPDHQSNVDSSESSDDEKTNEQENPQEAPETAVEQQPEKETGTWTPGGGETDDSIPAEETPVNDKN